MPLDIETLKSLQADLKCDNMDKVMAAVAYVGRLQYALLDEVVRLREQLNPTTPAGKLAAYRAAEAMVWSPPKVASWEFDTDEDGYKTGDLVSADGRGLAQFFYTKATGWFGVVNGDVLDGGESPPLDEDGPENVIRWCEGCAKAAGWELVGGAE